jgi:predicted amino acid dehydrogenase
MGATHARGKDADIAVKGIACGLGAHISRWMAGDVDMTCWDLKDAPAQSRAEQSRAEQSRAEQSRAEQSRAEQRLFFSFLVLLNKPAAMLWVAISQPVNFGRR